jgi:hypothetical protein
MKRIAFVLMALVVGYAAVQLGCMDREPAPVCPVPTELKDAVMQTGGFDGVDLLVMVDNSISMAQEQAILATSFFPLVNSLANPIHTNYPETDWPYEAAEELRIAVITSDLGFSYSGHNYNEYWPGSTLPDGCDSSSGLGDNGKFQDIDVSSVSIMDNVIPCDETGAQCPEGWSCTGMDDDDDTPGMGVCTGDAATPVACPDLGALWAETTDEAPDDQFTIKAACLADQGTGGCGFEQQLQSAVAALSRDDQVWQEDGEGAGFIRDSHLLAILMVSDEEDCSMQFGPEVAEPAGGYPDGVDPDGLFTEDEVQNQDELKLNIACGNHPNYLFTSDYFYEAYTGFKSVQAVVFAAIVGVPYQGDQADECQGTGSKIDLCNEQEDMELVAEQPDAPDAMTWFFRPACTRNVGDVEVTKAYPGRRYVDVAQEFGDLGYVYSICNPDWSVAMTEIARLIASKMGGTCYDKPLDWDPVERVAKCNVVVEYRDPEDEECPEMFGDDAEPIIEEVTSEEGESTTLMYCPVPKIPFDQDCGTQAQDLDQDTFGWYYCENLTVENFEGACSDGIDNDGDGDVDCEDTGDPDHPEDDPGCDGCEACGGLGVDCNNTCQYVVMLTEAAKAQIAGLVVSVQCLQQFSFEDANCQEDSLAACTDDQDNDGNGIWDCTTEADGASSLGSDEKAHLADPNCCPMTGEPGGCCDLAPAGIDQLYDEICPSGDVDYTGDFPDACWEAASRLECYLPGTEPADLDC